MVPTWVTVLFLLSYGMLEAHSQPSTTTAKPSPSLRLPDPRIVLVGGTGTGKSSLANALLGCDPNSVEGECMQFEVCDGQDSCTKSTSHGVGQWIGSGAEFTVIDTAGFDDTDDEDETLLDGMMDTLTNEIEYANTILLLLDSQKKRFDQSLQTMLKRITIIFGEKWWNHVVIGVSFWSFDEASIRKRGKSKRQPKDETWFKDQINSQICDKLHYCHKNFTFVFADSHHDRDEPQEVAKWQEQTSLLWEATTSREDSFGFKTINDILEENQRIKEENTRVKRENQQLTDVIQRDISQLTEKVDKLPMVPVGTILAWTPRPENSRDPVALPAGWQRCDGSQIVGGRWHGLYVPNINGEERFLRGTKIPSRVLTTEEDQVHRHDHSYVDTMLQSDSCYSGWTQDEDMKKYNEWENDGGDPDPNCYKRKRTGSYGDDETRPKNIRVIYIMKIY